MQLSFADFYAIVMYKRVGLPCTAIFVDGRVVPILGMADHSQGEGPNSPPQPRCQEWTWLLTVVGEGHYG